MEGPCADSEEKREPVSDINTVMADSLKELDPNGPELTRRLPGLTHLRHRAAQNPAAQQVLLPIEVCYPFVRGTEGDWH